MKKSYSHYLKYIIPTISMIIMLLMSMVNFAYGNKYVSLVEFVIGLALLIYILVFGRNKSKEMQEYMSLMTEQSGSLTHEVLSRFPLAMVVLSIDGKVLWYNEPMSEIFSGEDLFNLYLPDSMPELKWTEILKSTDDINLSIDYNEHNYNVHGSIIKHQDYNSSNISYSVLLYFKDRTDEVKAQKLYMNEKTDVAIITIDNYDDLFQAMDDTKAQETLVKINSIISKWVSEGNGLLKKIDKDRFLVFFEHQYLDAYIKNKFNILEKVRAVGDEIKEPITVSIGIGTGGHLIENEAYARNSVEMVWGRGGDQVAIKDDDNFKFYGGTTKDYEKSTRVKTRLFATALKDMINNADNVIIIGHKGADYDSFGAAIGILRAVKLAEKKPYIVLDNPSAVKILYDEMNKNPEYQDVIINENTAMEIVTENSLVIIVDTHRPSMLPAYEILNVVKKIVLIDHHRRSTEFIDNLSLMYLEPYASSTCEMVTEILQYIDDKKKMNSFEAKALYMGILIDTKNFVTKTGVRTFEAASYLKRYGVNTMEVKKVFNLSIDEYVNRLEIIKNAEIWNENIAVSVCESDIENIRIASSQAADEMLNISGIKAAFIIYQIETGICFSARSFGDINVQIIMEKLGGGGHMTVAGAQIKDISLEDAKNRLQMAISEYFEENKND